MYNVYTAIAAPQVSSPLVHVRVLEFIPGANTSFTCVPGETDEIDHTTFAVNHVMFQRNGMIPGVQFERQIRTTNGSLPAVTTTLTFDSGVNESRLCCCYFNGIKHNCRDCYLLVYYVNKGNHN